MRFALKVGMAAMVLCMPWTWGLAGVAPVARAEALDGLLAVSDYTPPAKVRFLDPESGAIAFDYRVEREGPLVCQKPEVVCWTLGFRHVTYHDNDYLDIAITVSDPPAGNLADMTYSIIQRIRLTHPAQEVWHMRFLDFSGVEDGSAYCVESPEGEEGYKTDPRCQIAFTHGFRVIDDRPDENTVTMVVADTLHRRVVQATLDYTEGNTVGRVDWVLGATNPSWPKMALPNAVQMIDEGADGRYLLVTFYSASLRPLGGGMLQMYRWEDEEWREMWRFPDPSAGEDPYLNTPHGGKLITDPVTGERRIWYSHSRGLATDWREMNPEGFGATYGMLIPGQSLSEPPTYVFDAAPFLDDPDDAITFSRDEIYLPDGTMLLADSACETFCRYTPRIVRTTRFASGAVTALDKSGRYTQDHGELNLIAIPDEAILDTYECGFHGIFEVEWLPSETLGTQLRSARTRPKRSCPGW